MAKITIVKEGKKFILCSQDDLRVLFSKLITGKAKPTIIGTLDESEVHRIIKLI